MRRGQDEPCFIVGFLHKNHCTPALRTWSKILECREEAENAASPAAGSAQRGSQAGPSRHPPALLIPPCRRLGAQLLGRRQCCFQRVPAALHRTEHAALRQAGQGPPAPERRTDGGRFRLSSSMTKDPATQGSALATLHPAPTPPTWQRLQRSQAPAGRRKAARPVPSPAAEPRWHRPSPPLLPGGTAPAERTWLHRRAAAGRWCNGRPWPAG